VASLEELRGTNWSEITPSRIQEIWPGPVRGLECTDEACSSIVREGRIINGEIECADVFDFNTEPTHGAAGKEQLRSVTIHYTAKSRREIVSIAKSFAGAVGLPATSVNAIGESSVQPFQWNSEDSKEKMSVLDLRLTRVGTGWRLFFSYLRRSPDVTAVRH